MRRHHLIFLISVLCIQFLVLTGCEKKQEVTMGRYIEQDIPTCDEKSYKKFQLIYQDGHQAFIDNTDVGLKYYRLQEDLSVKEEQPGWLEVFHQMDRERGYYICTMALDEKDRLYAVATANRIDQVANDTFDNQRTFLLKITETGIEEKELMIQSAVPIMQPQQLIIFSNGTCVISQDYNNIQSFDIETGEFIRAYDVKRNKVSIMAKENQLYVMDLANQQIQIYDIETGHLEGNKSCELMTEETIIFKGEDGLYLANHEGIWYQSDQGDIWEQIMEGDNVSLGLPSHEIKSAVYKDNHFTVVLDSLQDYGVAKAYVFSATTPSKPEIQLTAYMLEENSVFREVLLNYELKHPEVSIHVKLGVNENSGVSKEDAVKALHTELLTGNGPDLLLLDGLDYENYNNKGLLMPLDEVQGVSELLPNLREALEQEGHTFAVPLRFRVPCLIGKSEVLDRVSTVEELMAYQSAHMESSLIGAYEFDELYNYLARLESSQWIKADGSMDKEKLGSFLEGMKDLMSFSQQEDIKMDTYMETYGGSRLYGFNKVKAQLWYLEDAEDIWTMGGLVDAVPNTGVKFLTKEGKAYFEPVALVGINKNTEQKEYAQEILTALLADGNKQNSNVGLPTKENILKTQLETVDEWKGLCTAYDDEETFEYNRSSKTMIKPFEEMLKELELPVIRKATLETMVFEEASAYIKGEKSLEEVLATLAPKVALYNEG